MANGIKTLNVIQPYTPSDVPILGMDNPVLSQFLADEFKKISYPLTTLSNDFAPRYEVSMRGATMPTALTSSVQAVDNYAEGVASREVYNTNVVIDPIAGTITFGSDPSIQLLLKVDASLVMDRLSGSNNTTVFLHLVIDGVSQIISSSFASNQTDFMSLYGGFLGAVNGDSMVFLGVSYGGSANVAYVNSFRDIQVLGLIE